MSSHRHRKGHISVSCFVINLWFYENIVSVLNDLNGGNNWEVIGVEV